MLHNSDALHGTGPSDRHVQEGGMDPEWQLFHAEDLKHVNPHLALLGNLPIV